MSESLDAMEALLDATLDDIEDLPEFKPLPAGTHIVEVSLSLKEVNKHPSIEMKIKLVETKELANPNDTPAKPGDETSVLFMVDNEIGLGKLKLTCKPIQEALGTSSIRELVEQTKNITCAIVSNVRTDSNDKDKHYMNIKELAVVQ